MTVALVSLIDENRQWLKSCFGPELLGVRETGRDVAGLNDALDIIKGLYPAGALS